MRLGLQQSQARRRRGDPMRRARAVGLLLACCLAACESRPKYFTVDPPRVEPLMLRHNAVVSVSYSERLTTYGCTVTVDPPVPGNKLPPPDRPWRIALGEASVRMFENLLPKLFTQVVSPGAAPSGSARIHVDIAGYSVCARPDAATVEIEFALTVTPAGAEQGLPWHGVGRADASEFGYDWRQELGAGKFMHEQYLDQLTVAAMRAALADLVVNLHNSPSLVLWTESLASAAE